MRPVNGLSGNVTFTCTGAPRGATCAVEPGSITLDGTSVEQLKVTVTTSQGAALLPLDLPTDGTPRIVLLLGLLGLLIVAAVSHRRRSPVRRPALQRLALAAAMLLMLLWASCGGGGVLSLSGGGTPVGRYALTVTGTYASSTGSTPGTLANSTTLSLKVN